jgi:hypothetical protein
MIARQVRRFRRLGRKFRRLDVLAGSYFVSINRVERLPTTDACMSDLQYVPFATVVLSKFVAVLT